MEYHGILLNVAMKDLAREWGIPEEYAPLIGWRTPP